jgi:hypothetical protein
MLLIIRRLAVSSAALLMLGTSAAPLHSQESKAQPSLIDLFSGTWREDDSKRELGAYKELLFRRTASDGLEEVRGSEARPLIQQVVFDGKPHPIEGGNSIAWKKADATTFERALLAKGTGHLVNTRRIRLSDDGTTLTEVFEQNNIAGEPVFETVVYKRVGGDKSGLVGRWNPRSVKTTAPEEVKYERAGANAIRFSNSFGTNYVVSLDGTPAVENGATVIVRSMIAARAVDGRTMETTSSRDGIATERATLQLSPDGKLLTVTTLNLASNSSGKPSVAVFLRQ